MNLFEGGIYISNEKDLIASDRTYNIFSDIREDVRRVLTKERVCADNGKAVYTWCKLSSISDDPAT